MNLFLLATTIALTALDPISAQSSRSFQPNGLEKDDLIEWRFNINTQSRPSYLFIRGRTTANTMYSLMKLQVQGARNRISVQTGISGRETSQKPICPVGRQLIAPGKEIRVIIRALPTSFMIYINGSLKYTLPLPTSSPDISRVSRVVAYNAAGTHNLRLLKHMHLVREIQQQEPCGLSSLNMEVPHGCPQASLRKKIFGGTSAQPGAYPWQAAIRRKPEFTNFGQAHECGATLIAKCWAISAGHCFTSTLRSELNKHVVRVGDYYNRDDNANQNFAAVESSQDIGIKDIYKHIAYADDPTPQNDIILIRLKTCVTFGPLVAPICLPTSPDQFRSNLECGVSGWGAQNNTVAPKDYPSCLQIGHVNLFKDENCTAAYGDKYKSRQMLCAGKPGVDSCRGDSGGPLVCSRDNKRFTLWGITSWGGKKCAHAGEPGVYTRVSSYIKWIYINMNLFPNDSALQRDMLAGTTKRAYCQLY